jgi:teichoic acid transport system ATP-binding protein
MRSEVAISVKNLAKTYRIFDHPGDRIKQALTFGQKRFHHEFTALQDVSFQIKKGETVGIIGRNGSGKSTLLQLICGILKPTSGTVQVNGRISALLELGAGFNPEFTGRENVYFQGAVLGRTNAEMEACFQDIADFADIGEFIDQPVRTYSNGMFVRLAFATAIHVEPDILVIDEALSVGDMAFQSKCLHKISALQAKGVTILLVTHNTDQVISHCGRGLLINAGHLSLDGTAKVCVFAYKQLLTSGGAISKPTTAAAQPHQAMSTTATDNGESVGTGQAQFLQISIHDSDDAPTTTLSRNMEFAIRARVRFLDTLQSPLVFFTINDVKGTVLCGISTLAKGIDFGVVKKDTSLDIAFRQLMLLNAGEYFLSLGCQTLDANGHLSHDLRWECMTFQVVADSQRPGVFDPQSLISWDIGEFAPIAKA